jgi:type IV secretory pathway TrbL component
MKSFREYFEEQKQSKSFANEYPQMLEQTRLEMDTAKYHLGVAVVFSDFGFWIFAHVIFVLAFSFACLIFLFLTLIFF